MRLIDADVLMNEANSDGAYGYVDAKQISEVPTIDAVEVVRCKDCKWLYGVMDDYCCINHKGLVEICENSFCSHGERKDGAD